MPDSSWEFMPLQSFPPRPEEGSTSKSRTNPSRNFRSVTFISTISMPDFSWERIPLQRFPLKMEIQNNLVQENVNVKGKKEKDSRFLSQRRLKDFFTPKTSGRTPSSKNKSSFTPTKIMPDSTLQFMPLQCFPSNRLRSDISTAAKKQNLLTTKHSNSTPDSSEKVLRHAVETDSYEVKMYDNLELKVSLEHLEGIWPSTTQDLASASWHSPKFGVNGMAHHGGSPRNYFIDEDSDYDEVVLRVWD